MSLQETIREDGLRLITKYLPHTGKVVVEIMAGFGSAHDPPGQEGLAHFFEHMAFKGTQKRRSDEISADLGRYCNFYNASTDRLETSYYGQGAYIRLNEISDILFDMYANSTFPAEEIDKERDVIELEIARNNDQDSRKAYFQLQEMLWKDNPLRRFGAGTPDSLKNITRDLIDEKHQNWYIPSNTLVLATGKIDHRAILDQINSSIPINFRAIPDKMYWGEESDNPPLEQRSVIPKPDRQKGIVLMGCKIPILANKDSFDIDLLADTLGKDFDSLLTQEIREKRAYAYSVRSYLSGDARLGYYLSAMAEVKPKRLQETEKIMEEVLCGYPLNKGMFERKRDSKLDEWLTAFEGPWEWQSILKQIIVERGKGLNEVNKIIKKIRKTIEQTKFDDLVSAREKYLTPERLATVIIQPV